MAWELEPMNELLLHFSDYNGARATMNFWLENTETDPGAGGAAAIAAGAQGMSDDALTSVEILRHATWDEEVTPTDGPYARPSNKMNITFRATDGTKTTMQVPGPNETILAADHISIDLADAAVIAFVDYTIENILSSEGAALTGVQRGVRRIPPRLKKQ